MEMHNRMNRLGADGYYLLHNHPSGEPRPSQVDLSTTKFYKDNIKVFKGHIIINSNKYASIDVNLGNSINDLNLGEDKLLNPSIDHPLLGEKITNPQKLAQVSKELQLDKNQSAVFYMDSQLKVRAIQEIPSKMLNNEKAIVDYLRGRMKEFGSANVFINANGDNLTLDVANLVRKGYVLDGIVNNDESTISIRNDMGITPKTDNSKWMGTKINKGVRVNESKEEYNKENADIISAKHVVEYVMNPKNKLKNDPVKDFVNTLHKFRNQGNKMVPVHFAVEAMLNKEGFRNQIEQAYNLVRGKYENNRAALKTLDNYFGHITEKPFFDNDQTKHVNIK